MKKFLALVVMFCAVMISSTASADAPLCDENVPTMTQRLQGMPDMKIWGMEQKVVDGVAHYIGHFGDNNNNWLAFLLRNDGKIRAVVIESQFGDDSLIVEQMLKLACGTLVIAGVTIEDVGNLMQELVNDMEKALAKNSGMKEYEQSFSARSAQTGRKIILNLSAKEISSDFGEFQFFIYAE